MYHSTEHLENQIERLRAELTAVDKQREDFFWDKQRVEAERDALREALERINHCQYGPNTAPLMDIARAALAPSLAGEKSSR